MQRRQFLAALVPVALAPVVGPRIIGALRPERPMGASLPGSVADTLQETAIRRLGKKEEAWKGQISDDAYDVLFDEDTERPFSSPLNAEKRAGTFVCAACYLPLFSSAHKYESGTGWPSFWQPINANRIGTKKDFKLILPRTEYHCARCGGHQGHVFDDGPQPTGLRYCNNGLALRFIPDGTALPALRS